MSRWIADAAKVPAVPGAYVLKIILHRSAPLPPRFGTGRVPAGAYLYCGSARGGGGLQARCGRHLAAEKPLRWHVDWLTVRAARRMVWPVPGGDECTLRAALTTAGAIVPVPGFGSSDCPHCPAHLLAWPGPLRAVTAVLRELPPQDV